MQDEAGYTLLHSCAYYNVFKIAEYIISYFKRRFATFLRERYLRKNNLSSDTRDIPSKELEIIKFKVHEIIKTWINYPSKGDEGFYPLHFASFHGNVKLIKLFRSYGANIYSRNK
jgi:ankyrin repeat protein